MERSNSKKDQIQITPDQTTINFKTLDKTRFKIGYDLDGQIPVYLHTLLDLVTGKAFGSSNPLPSAMYGTNGAVWSGAIGNENANSDAGIVVLASQRVYNNVSTVHERLRTPTIFKTQVATLAGNTTLWTPTSGKKFRVLGGNICISKDAACAGAQQILLIDAAGTQIFRIDLSTAALVATGNVIVVPFAFGGNGYLSAVVNNPLNIYLNGAFTAGNVSVTCWGTEE